MPRREVTVDRSVAVDDQEPTAAQRRRRVRLCGAQQLGALLDRPEKFVALLDGRAKFVRGPDAEGDIGGVS